MMYAKPGKDSGNGLVRIFECSSVIRVWRLESNKLSSTRPGGRLIHGRRLSNLGGHDQEHHSVVGMLSYM